jgi:hypothetical protein
MWCLTLIFVYKARSNGNDAEEERETVTHSNNTDNACGDEEYYASFKFSENVYKDTWYTHYRNRATDPTESENIAIIEHQADSILHSRIMSSTKSSHLQVEIPRSSNRDRRSTRFGNEQELQAPQSPINGPPSPSLRPLRSPNNKSRNSNVLLRSANYSGRTSTLSSKVETPMYLLILVFTILGLEIDW